MLLHLSLYPLKLSDGHWSEYSPFSICLSCKMNDKTGTKTRNRKCSNPAPSQGGKACMPSTQPGTVITTDSNNVVTETLTADCLCPIGELTFSLSFYNKLINLREKESEK